jgi:hypothetical protein
MASQENTVYPQSAELRVMVVDTLLWLEQAQIPTTLVNNSRTIIRP